MEKLRLSKYIKIVKRRNDYAVYHSIFGQLCLMDLDGLNLLKSFRMPNSFNDIKDIHKQFNSNDIRIYIDNLKSRYFLVEDGYDEYDIVEKNKGYRNKHLSSGYLIRGLQLILSNTCNFNCKYCFANSIYNSKERLEFQHSESNKIMSANIAKTSMEKLIYIVKKNGGNTLNVEFFGGEPLTNWNTIKYVLETFGNNDSDEFRILYSITTNGSLITDEISQILKKHNVTITISFDSPKNTDRVSLNGENLLKIIKPKLEILKKNNNWVSFNSVLSKETISDYDGRGLVDFAKQYGISNIALILDLNLEFYQSDYNKNIIINKLWDTYNYSIKKGISVSGYWYQIFNQIIGIQELNLISGYKTCPSTGCKLSVEPEGHVFACKCCSGYMGNIHNIEEVLISSKYKNYAMRAYRNSAECENCELDGFCSGVCMGSLEKKYNSLNIVEKSFCDIFKEITHKLIKNVSENKVDILYLSDNLKEVI